MSKSSTSTTLICIAVENPVESDFLSKLGELLVKMAEADVNGGNAQGILVFPKNTPMYLYTEEISAAAHYGVLILSSPDLDIARGAQRIEQHFHDRSKAFDVLVAKFHREMQLRKKELEEPEKGS